MKFFVRIKHWQLFLLLLIPNIIGGYYLAISHITSLMTWLVYAAWLISISSIGNKKINKEYFSRDNKWFLRCSFILPVSIVIDMLISVFEITAAKNPGVILDGFAMMIRMLIFIGYVYLFYYSSQTLAILEQRRASSSATLKYVFLIFLNILGLWFVQPKVNKYLGND